MENGQCIMETYTNILDIMNPAIDDINIEDIAHGLSLICRFGGQCHHFYSVAEHSLNVQQDLRREGYDIEVQLIGLLHDATEAYLGDMITPIKKINPDFKMIEENLEKLIFKKFKLDYPREDIKKIIKDSDQMVFYNEAILLMKRKDIWLPKDQAIRMIPIAVTERKPIDVELEYQIKAQALIKKLER